ncbi:hypothetical protein U1Q18_005897 [Sarracenia purpurea var. burkii]
MKIQCDVCNEDEASVFCTADEAVLCAACDHRVHHANKLAGKHHRFSLLRPSSPKHFPLCDICKERRAFLFCQQDRAILCRDCDVPIHKTNVHTQKHSRFLLTGVKLSATSALYSTTPSNSAADLVPNLRSSQSSTSKPVSVQPAIPNPPTITKASASVTVASSATGKGGHGNDQQTSSVSGGGSTSSISEYLIEMLPGWRVEDFLDSPPPSFGFCKADVMPIWDANLESNLSSFSSPQNIGIWVPQAPQQPLPPYPSFQYSSSNMSSGGHIGFKEATNNKSSRKWRDDGCFTVPEITSKRSRIFW